MILSRFITENMEAIVAEWQAFAMTMTPAASTMSVLALRDHAKAILQAIAKDLASEQTQSQQSRKARGLVAPAVRETAAATHGALRHLSGFDLNQLGAEYRALRASVIRLWTSANPGLDDSVVQDMIRFNEAVDQAVAESTERYAAELALSRDTFMAILAHDLRSPLSAIAMLSHLLELHGASEAARAQAGQIRRSAKEMSGMIRDLLEYTRTNLGKGIPVVQLPCNIGSLCRQSLEEVRAGNPGREFLLNVPEELAGVVDGARLRQALSNLLNNAVQHGAADTPVTLTAKASGEWVVLEVRNRGPVIPAESLQSIFDPLVQLAPSAAKPGESPSTNLGLGLFIAREVALGHGGDIGVESDETHGTVFRIRLPAGAPRDRPAA